MLGGAAFLVGANQRHLLADVFVEKFCGLEQIVFVVLLDDAELVRVGERAEMHGSRIDGGGDVHELQAKRAGGKHEIADVANQRNVGVVNRDVQLGLIIQPGGLIGDRAGRFSFLELRNGFVPGRGISDHCAGSENGGGAKPPRGWRNCGDFHFAFTSIGICLLG